MVLAPARKRARVATSTSATQQCEVFELTTPSEMASGATHSNSAPTDSEPADEAQPDSEPADEAQPDSEPADEAQPDSEQKAKRELFETFMAAGKSVVQGLSSDDLLDKWARLYFDGQLQRANIAHMKE